MSCEGFLKKLSGKKFSERSLKSQEKYAESAIKLSEIVMFGSFVWLAMPFLISANQLLAKTDSGIEKLGIFEIFRAFLKPYENFSLMFFWFIIFICMLFFAVYFRRRALDYFDDFEKNKQVLDIQ